MKFDHTKGKPAKYAVQEYAWNIEDTHYFSTYRDAKAFFNKLTANVNRKGVVISLYNIREDIRKEFIKQ